MYMSLSVLVTCLQIIIMQLVTHSIIVIQVPLGSEEIDVEGFDDIEMGGARLPMADPIGVVGEGGASIDQMLLMQDLEHSSSSSSSEEEDEDEFEDV